MQLLSGAQHSVRTDCYTINVRPAKQQCLWNNSYMKAIALNFTVTVVMRKEILCIPERRVRELGRQPSRDSDEESTTH